MTSLFMLRHPTNDLLEAFPREASPSSERRRVADHIAVCVDCQKRVRSFRDMRNLAATLPTPSMAPDLLDRIQRRVAAGDLVMLSTPTAPAPRTHRGVGAVAALVAACLVLLWLFPATGGQLEAGASGGELNVVSRARTSPAALSITYRPASPLAGDDSVLLRASLFAPRQYGTPSSSTFTLRRGDDGKFVGEVTLPADAVLARFTLASVNGKHVDDNDGRQWEIVVTDTLGRPRFEGLDVQSAIHSYDDWEQSYDAALAMLRHYPENPRSVRSALYASLELKGAARADSVIAAFRPRIDSLQRRYADAPLDADQIWEMAMLTARTDRAAYRHWLDRAKREFPRDPGTLQLQTFAIMSSERPDAERLSAMDSLWSVTGSGAIQLASEGFNLANKFGDPVAVERWGDRFAKYPGWSLAAADAYLKYPTLRAKGTSIVRESLRELPAVTETDWQSALSRPVPNSNFVPAGSTSGQRAQWPLMALGEALLADDKVNAARDTLRRATAIAWSVQALALLGDAELRGGDTTAAVTAYGWALADPRLPAARADSIRRRIPASRNLDAAIESGRRVLADLTLRRTYRRALATDAEFADADGKRRRLRDVVGPGIAVIAVVSRTCAPSLKDLKSLQSLSRRLASGGMRLATFVEESPNQEVQRELAEHGFTGPVLFDDRAEVSRTLRQFGTPRYYVVENGKTIRADVMQASDLLIIIEALK